jgi:hypothetical protein
VAGARSGQRNMDLQQAGHGHPGVAEGRGDGLAGGKAWQPPCCLLASSAASACVAGHQPLRGVLCVVTVLAAMYMLVWSGSRYVAGALYFNVDVYNNRWAGVWAELDGLRV